MVCRFLSLPLYKVRCKAKRLSSDRRPFGNNAIKKRPKSTQSPSAKAIEMAERLPTTAPFERLKEVNAIFAAHPASEEDSAYRPMSELLRKQLQDSFKRDLDEIGKMPR